MDTLTVFREQRAQLEASTRALTGTGATWITRGPRDTVPARKVLDTVRAAGVPGFDALSETTRLLLASPDPIAAATALRIDPNVVPFLTVPTGRFTPSAVSPHRMFDVPFFAGVPGPPIPIDEFKSLMVIHSAVLDDPARTYDACTNTGTPGGVWTFGHLIQELSLGSGLTPEQFLMQWLTTWQFPQPVNGVLVDDPARGVSMQGLIADWHALSGSTLNVNYFPARLLAIVNRPDLADKIGYGAAGTAGEARFVFGLGQIGVDGECRVQDFTVILEYGVKGGSCSAVKSWHQRWKNLALWPAGSAGYRNALQAITLDFTEAGTNPAQSPNQSSLNQLRTNEGALYGIWQLREFTLRPPGDAAGAGTLGLVTVKQTPDGQFRHAPLLAQYLLAAEGDILADKHVVPEKFPTALDAFLGGFINSTEPDISTYWSADLSGLSNPFETRRKFSLATCDACHGGETGTFFTHIGVRGQRNLGSSTALSKFLLGTSPVVVPESGEPHLYQDLKEREQRMSDILTTPCFNLMAIKRLSTVH
jgi:hypothetical protein